MRMTKKYKKMDLMTKKALLFDKIDEDDQKHTTQIRRPKTHKQI